MFFMKKTTTGLFLLLILTLACSTTNLTPDSAPQTPLAPDSAAEPSTTLTEIDLPVGYGFQGSWFELYFTDPTDPLSSQQTGGIDQPLADAIDSAKLSVDIAIYSLSLNSIRDAILRAHDRGVQVRMVMESENMERSDPQRLEDAGIPILGDRREGLMHNKFVVIDGSEVWVGGMNYTDSGTYEDNNVMLRIRSVKMAENFTKEFEEMFVEDRFGDNVLAETPNPRVTIDGMPVDVYFSPDDGVQAILLDILNDAQESIYFMAFSFTADELGNAIRERAESGVTVAGVMDEEQVKSNQGTEFDAFRQAGLDVYIDGNPGQMHHKIMIVDESIVIVGSYNFTNSAETRNDENLLVIYNDQIAAQFIEEFKRVYGQAK
jgi:phosphatidylserine/phosphatidylglycerophosphate/cardiolipin synthase-like enzyme